MKLSQNKSSVFLTGQIVLAALALLLVAITCYCDPMMSRDGAFYADLISGKVHDGQCFFSIGFVKPPLFLLAVYCICLFFACAPERGMLLLNAVSLAISVFPITYIGRKLLNSRAAALFCAAWLITSPLLLETVRRGTREPMFFCLGLLCLAFAFRSCSDNIHGEWPLLVLSAIFGAFSTLTRFEGAGFVLASLLIIVSERKSHFPFGYKAVRVLFCASVSCLTVLILALISTEVRSFLLYWGAKFLRSIV